MGIAAPDGRLIDNKQNGSPFSLRFSYLSNFIFVYITWIFGDIGLFIASALSKFKISLYLQVKNITVPSHIFCRLLLYYLFYFKNHIRLYINNYQHALSKIRNSEQLYFINCFWFAYKSWSVCRLQRVGGGLMGRWRSSWWKGDQKKGKLFRKRNRSMSLCTPQIPQINTL
jgi:hypothetical protein